MTRTGVISGILLSLVLLLALAGSAGAQPPPISLELSGVNAVDLPQVQVTANVYDALGQPLNGLTADNFRLSGPLSDVAAITGVENIANNELPFGTVLVIDASESMAGAPLERARAAARTYIENLRDIDPVALVAFGSTVEVLQDFTTDRDALLAAIDSIDFLGRTALYQAAWEGVNLAAESPTPRRAMVLLSDGVEYGGLSDVTADEVIENAFLKGVPSYTIGLGYGADRSFLERLAAETLAQFYESPTPEELQGIYTGLADRLTSQYVITLDVQAAQDGTEYPFVLTVESGGASANQIGTVRAPIPVPIVDLSGLPTEPISAVTDLPITVRADQDISRVVETLGGAVVADLTSEPYTLQIDPADFPPGPLVLEVSATDADGETGTASVTLEIAALPPQISLSRDVSELGAIDEPLEITVNAGGQTPITDVRFSLNGGEFVTLAPPFTFTLDPLQLPPGDNSLDVVVTNAGGQEGIYSADFIIADVPPSVTIDLLGVLAGQPVDAPITFQINAVGQTPVAEVAVTLGGAPLEAVDGVYTIDPMTVPPGETELSVSVTTEQGQTGTASATLMIAPLSPIVQIEGIEDGQTVTGDQTITIDAVAQTPVIHGMVLVNGEDVAHPVQLPATITLPFSAMQPGENTVEISLDTAAGQNGRLSLTFLAPAALFTPTPTNTPTPNQTATAAAAAQAAATRTTVANAASTAAAGTQMAATEGAQAGATQAAATQGAVTAQAQTAATQAAGTQSAVTAQAQAAATQSAVTAQAQAAATQSAVTAQAQAAATQSAVTAQAQNQATEQASTLSASTAVAQAATRVPATVAPSATPQPASATPAPATAMATADRATSDAPATVQAAAAFVQQAATNARATVAVQQSATAGAQATIQATATQAAQATQATATQVAQATQAAATQAAQATQSAVTQAAQVTQSAVTQAAQATQAAAEAVTNATATRQAQATAQVQTNQTATALAESISTATQQAGRTATQQAQATTSARSEASATAQANREATAAAGTEAAQTAEAQAAAQTGTAEASRAAATAGAQATRTARAELAAQTATAAVTDAPTAAPSATTEITAEAQAVEPTQTVQPTLTPVEVESQSGGGSATTGLWAVFVAIIVIAVAVVLWITRARKRRFDKP